MFKATPNIHRLIIRIDGVQAVYDIFVVDETATQIKNQMRRYISLEKLIDFLYPRGFYRNFDKRIR